MGVNIKMGVDIGGFTAGIREGQNVLRGLNAEMKATEAEFKATGNAEQMLTSKTKTLTSQLNVQKGIADTAQAALQKMADAGVDKASEAYQKMYVQLMNAQAGMNEAQAALNALDGEQQAAAQSANELADGMASIGKKISLDQVITGIGKITSGLENAARKAAELSGKIWDTIMESAQWGDDIATQASMAQMSIEDYQRVVNVAATAGETSVSSLIKSWKKLKMNLSSNSKDVKQAFSDLNIQTLIWGDAGESGPSLIARDYMDVFWEIGDALMAMGDGADQERYAQTLLGRSWQELIPMFLMGREAYEEALKSQDTVTKDSVKNLGELNDKVIKVQQQFDALKSEVIGQIAPAFTEAAGVISDLLHNVNEYLKTDEGQEMLESLGTAVSGLFDDLSKIDPQEVVKGFTDVFNTVVDSVKWVVDHSGEVIGALEAVVTGWGLLKLTGGALEIVNLINGISGLSSGTAAANAAAAGAAAGTSWGGAFAAAALAAAPWLLAVLASNLIPDENKVDNEARVESAEASKEEVENLREWVKLQNELNEIAGKYGTAEYDEDLYLKLTDQATKLAEAVQSGELWDKYWDYVWAQPDAGQGEMPTEVLDKMIEKLGGDEGLKIDVTPEIPDNAKELVRQQMGRVEVETAPKVDSDAAAEIAAQVGTVSVPVSLTWDRTIGGAGGGKDWNVRTSRANGLPYVPYDGYLAELHRGEMVVPAREISSRNYSSNLYVESMIMNNGTDAQGLAAAMAAAQRRTMAGYGS